MGYKLHNCDLFGKIKTNTGKLIVNQSWTNDKGNGYPGLFPFIKTPSPSIVSAGTETRLFSDDNWGLQYDTTNKGDKLPPNQLYGYYKNISDMSERDRSVAIRKDLSPFEDNEINEIDLIPLCVYLSSEPPVSISLF